MVERIILHSVALSESFMSGLPLSRVRMEVRKVSSMLCIIIFSFVMSRCCSNLSLFFIVDYQIPLRPLGLFAFVLVFL